MSRYLMWLLYLKQLFFLEDGFYSIHLEALSPTDSQAMLMHYVQNLTTAQANELHTVVGGCPLALKVVANLLRKGKGLQWLLANLKQNVTFTLSKKSTREEDQLHRVIDIAFKNYMDRQSRKCAHILSLFPGSVSEEMVNSVLSEIVDLDPLCIENVTRLSFLEEFSIEELQRFSIHTVIQGYLQSVHVIQSDIKAFNSSFLSFYSDYLTIAMKQSYMYAHANVSDEDSYLLNDLESHNMNEFVPILLSTDIDKELTLYSAIALGLLIHENRIPDAYNDEVLLKAQNLYSRSLIFNSLCAYSSKEVCTSIFWNSFSFVEIQNECNSYFSYISNFFFTQPICSQLYNCSNGASSYTCKLITKLEWIRTFLTPTKSVLLITICLVTIVYRGIENTTVGAVLLLLTPLVLHFPWIVNIYVWCQLYFGFWYNTCISISYYVEEWQCTHLPTSFINNTMSDMCNNTTSIVEEHGMFLVILSMAVPLVATAMISNNITNNRYLDEQIIVKCVFFNLGILMFGCSVVSRLITSLTIFYITYILINMLPLLFCYIIHYKNTFVSLLSNNQNRIGQVINNIMFCLIILLLPVDVAYYIFMFIIFLCAQQIF